MKDTSAHFTQKDDLNASTETLFKALLSIAYVSDTFTNIVI